MSEALKLNSRFVAITKEGRLTSEFIRALNSIGTAALLDEGDFATEADITAAIEALDLGTAAQLDVEDVVSPTQDRATARRAALIFG